MEGARSGPAPTVVGVDMGYGHLRAAWPLAEALGTTVTRADLSPMADASEMRIWAAAREAYVRLSRLSQRPLIGRPFSLALDRLTAIRPSAMRGGGRRTDRSARLLSRCIESGLGATLCRHLEALSSPLLATFYAPSIAADRGTSLPVYCVATDSDVHRVWVPVDAGTSRIHYLVPTAEAARRLSAYGVRSTNITVTGFPLPPDLEADCEGDLARRLERLERRDSSPPRITLAIGGAGAQADRARQLLRSLVAPLKQGDLRLALVAGTRAGLGQRYRRWVAAELGDARDSVEVLVARTFTELYGEFNRLLRRTDILWTKPSELSFYAALGLPLILDDPVGDHERANARWLLAAGAGLPRPPANSLAETVPGWLADGTLARCARHGFERLPRGGTASIVGLFLSHS